MSKLQKKSKKEFNLNDQHAIEFFEHITRESNRGLKGAGLASSALNFLHKGLDKVQKLRGKKHFNKLWIYKAKSGEHHAVFIGPNGRIFRARFNGPGTKLLQGIRELFRLYDGDIDKALAKSSFVSEADREGLAHDIRYALADEDVVKERVADLKFIKVGKRLLKDKREKKINIQPSLKAIQAKVLAEKAGLTKRGKFLDPGPKDPDTIKLFKDVLSKLEQEGLGHIEVPIKTRPAREIKGSDRIPCEFCARVVRSKNMRVHRATIVCRRARGLE